eukprot:1423968-Ditylum_brightwellii.AAC.1
MNCPVRYASTCKVKDGKSKRVSLIAYGRNSIVEAFKKADKYNSYLSAACQFHNSLDERRTTISCDLVKDLTMQANNG